MHVIVIIDVFPYTGQAQSDVADITVLLYHGCLTDVTLDGILSTAVGVHSYSIFYNVKDTNVLLHNKSWNQISIFTLYLSPYYVLLRNS
jgi:hypothetical protein